MPVNSIGNPAGVLGQTAKNDQVCIELVNNSGGTLTDGDLVVVDVTGCLANTTTTALDKTMIGVVSVLGSVQPAAQAQTVTSGKNCLVAIGGVARINIGANTVAAGDILTSTVSAKVAGTNNAATVGQAIGIALEASAAKDSNNTIRALIQKM